MITNRGVRIWPNGHPETCCIEQWRLRFSHKEKNQKVFMKDITQLMEDLAKDGFDIIKMENLYLIDGEEAYSSAKG
jgi:isocitrate dehydrogenase